MSHATDGELHAYLDGALASIDPARADRLTIHLDACSDCSVRLADARALRARAGEILADAEPELVGVPPFEAILERRAKTGAPDRASSPTPIHARRSRPPLAWAASVAIALGAGWLGHAVWSRTPGPDGPAPDDLARSPRVESATIAEASEDAGSASRAGNLGFAEAEGGGLSSNAQEPGAAGAVDRVTATEGADDVRESGTEVDARQQLRLENRVAGRADERGEDKTRIAVSELRVPPAAPEPVVPTGAAPAAGERENRPPPAEPEREVQLAEVVKPAEEPEPSIENRARRAADAEAGEGNEAVPAAQKAAGDAPVDARAAGQVAAEAPEEGARRGFGDARGDYSRDALTLDARFLGGRLTWLPVSREDAEDWIGGPVLAVPDLEPAGLAISKLGEARLVRIVQTLPGGETLELIQETLTTGLDARRRELAVAAPDAEAAFEADLAQSPEAFLVLERDGFRISARALVATDSLRSLLSRLR